MQHWQFLVLWWWRFWDACCLGKSVQINLQNDRVSDPCGQSPQIHTWEAQTSPDNPSHSNIECTRSALSLIDDQCVHFWNKYYTHYWGLSTIYNEPLCYFNFNTSGRFYGSWGVFEGVTDTSKRSGMDLKFENYVSWQSDQALAFVWRWRLMSR